MKMAKLVGSYQKDTEELRKLRIENQLIKEQFGVALDEATRLQRALDAHISSRTNLILTV